MRDGGSGSGPYVREAFVWDPSRPGYEWNHEYTTNLDMDAHLFVFKLTYGVNEWGDKVELWYDPMPGLPEPAADAETSANASDPYDLRFDRFNIYNKNSGNNMWVDEIRIGTTWDAVTPTGYDTYTWSNPSGGYWTNANNWSGSDGYPSGTDVEVILPDYGGGDITITLDTAVTVSVLKMSHITNQSYTVDGVDWSGTGSIYFSNDFTDAYLVHDVDVEGNDQSFELMRLYLYFPQDTEFNAGLNDTSSSQTGLILNNCDLHGVGPITKLGLGGWRITGDSTDGDAYTGVILNAAGAFHLAANNPLPNATIILQGPNSGLGSKIQVWNEPYGSSGLLVVTNGAQFQVTGVDNTSTWNDVTLLDWNQFQIVDSACFFNITGTFSGKGDVQQNSWKASNPSYGPWDAGITLFTGAISPDGTNGTFEFAEKDGAFAFGSPDDRLELIIDSSDQISCTGMTNWQGQPNIIDLANIDLTVPTAITDWSTNWFLTSDYGITGVFNSVSIDQQYILYDYANNRVGISVPEPALLGVLALAAAALLRRR